MRNDPISRRRLLKAGAKTMGAAFISPRTLMGMSTLASDIALDGLGTPVPVKIDINADKPIRTMRGGIGASIHVMSRKLPGRTGHGNSSWSGSGWGGNPDADDDKHWAEVFRHAEWLGLDWCRVEMEQGIYEPERRKFDWNNPEMRVLYRILDWAERRNVDVFLQQMWSDVAWNALPGNETDPIKRLRSAPASVEEWAYGLGELIDHLTGGTSSTCIRWLSPFNEPGHDEWSWWQDAQMKTIPFQPAMRALRADLDRRGLQVSLSGPDWVDLPELHPSEIDFDASIGCYDLHSYGAVFDSMTTGYSLADTEKRLTSWAEWAHAHNKPLFLSEIGTMAFGWGDEDPGPASYQAGLKNASLIVRGINVGVDGFSRWSFLNRGDLDGQWQLLRTWDIDSDKLMETFQPQPNAYYQYAMLSRYLPKNSSVLAARVDAPFEAADRKLVATALRTPKGHLTIMVVNESQRAADCMIALHGLTSPVTLHRYSVNRHAEDKTFVQLRPERTLYVGDHLVDRIPPMSIVTYSSYLLDANAPGILAE